MRETVEPGTQTRRKNYSLQPDTAEDTEMNRVRAAVGSEGQDELRLVRLQPHRLQDEVVRAVSK